MLPNKQANYVIGHLMKACYECKKFEFDPSNTKQLMFYSTAKNQHELAGHWKDRFDAITIRLAKWLDDYPPRFFIETMQTWIADVYECNLGRAQTRDPFVTKVSAFFARVASPDEWQVLVAVTGLAMNQLKFNVGRGEFFIMDERELHQWALRRGSN